MSLGAELAEGFCHFLAHACVIAAVIGHYGVNDDESIIIGDHIEYFGDYLTLPGRDHIAGINTVKVDALLLPMAGDGQHIVREIADGIVGEHCGMSGKHCRGHAGALNACSGNNGQRNGKRTLSHAGKVIYSSNSFKSTHGKIPSFTWMSALYQGIDLVESVNFYFSNGVSL